MSFGKQLKEWRKAKGLTQQDLATAVGVNVSYISNLERDFSANTKSGKPTASETLTEKFAKILGVEVDEVRVAAGYAPKNTPPVPKPILDALARSGSLSDKDAILIAGIIDQIEKQNNENAN